MLRGINSLLFPRLDFIGDVEDGRKDSDVWYGLYRLDWKWVEDRKRKDKEKQHNVRVTREEAEQKKGHNDSEMLKEHEKEFKFKIPLPQKWMDWVDSLRFKLSYNYLEELRRNAFNAVTEWSLERHFDTMVRQKCLNVAEAQGQVAF